MAKAGPWEKRYYRKVSVHVMGVHNFHRKENADLKKIYSYMDPKRQKSYRQILKDAMPKDVNAVEMCHHECQLVTGERMDDMEQELNDLEAADAAAAAGAAAPAAGAAAPAAAADPAAADLADVDVGFHDMMDSEDE